jgi:hypothetical protein
MNEQLQKEWDYAHKMLSKAIKASIDDADARDSEDAIVPDWLEYLCEHCQARLWAQMLLIAETQ